MGLLAFLAMIDLLFSSPPLFFRHLVESGHFSSPRDLLREKIFPYAERSFS